MSKDRIVVESRTSVDEAPLLGLTVSPEHRRAMTWLGRFVLALTALTALVAQREIIVLPGFFGPSSNMMTVAGALTAFFLLSEARRSASLPLLGLAFAFAASSWCNVGLYLVFPGTLFLVVEPWQRSAALWMTLFGHATFLAGAVLYYSLEHRRTWKPALLLELLRRGNFAHVVVGANVILASCVSAAGLAAAFVLPQLVDDSGITLPARLMFGTLLTCAAAFIGCMYAGTRRRAPHLLDAWLFVVMLAATCDIELLTLGGGRYSLGWYVSRIDGMITNAAILLALCYEFVRLRESAAISRRQAHYDFLTDLPNRAMLSERIAAALAGAQACGTSVAVLFFDLDRFKSVNDTLGHEAGDEVLRVAGRRIKAHLRDGDTAARLGGDEFIVLLPDLTAAADALPIAETLRAAIRQPTLIAGAEIEVRASIGISLFPIDARDEKTLLHCSDAALYEAKRAGGNRVVRYESSINHVVTDRGRLADEIHRAFERGEFVLYYQPIVTAATLELVGAEALVRWASPERGLVAPATFLKTAEDSGEIVAIGDALLDRACAQLAHWRAAFGCNLTLSFNLSARQFVQRDLFATLRRALLMHGLAPHMLELELTESSLFGDLDHAQTVLRDCRDFGLRVAIDDFGTGYNSLTYLRKLPLTTLKIDRSFVAEIGTDRHAEAIVSALLSLSQTIGLRVIAEGVETAAQLTHLRDLGCDAVQGYLISRPLSPADFERKYLAKPFALPTTLTVAEI